MIKLSTKGYYVYEKANIWQERTEWEPAYYVSAKLFLENGRVLTTSKVTNNNPNFEFNKSDFEEDKVSIHYYHIINSQEFYCVESEDDIEEDKFYYDIISKEKIAYRETGELLKFVKWDD